VIPAQREKAHHRSSGLYSPVVFYATFFACAFHLSPTLFVAPLRFSSYLRAEIVRVRFAGAEELAAAGCDLFRVIPTALFEPD
jgi:hypothetical protein